MAMKNPVHPGAIVREDCLNPWACRSPSVQRGLASGAKRFPTW